MTTEFWTAQSLAGTVTSEVFDLEQADAGVQLVSASATRAGTFSFQVGNDGTNFSEVSTSTVVTATAYSHCEGITTNFRYLRVVWTPTGGAGTVTGTLNLKKRG